MEEKIITFGLKAHIRTKDVYRDETKAFFFVNFIFFTETLYRPLCYDRHFRMLFFYWENTWTGSLLPSFPHPGQDKSLESWPIHAAGAGLIDVVYVS